MANKDVFSSLYRWAHGQGENFTTDAFAALLREMIKRDAALASRFLGWLCFDNETCAFFGSTTEVDTQWVAQFGRPDIRITDRRAFALVEVKTSSDLAAEQLQKYRKILDAEPATREKALVLLTAFDASVGEDKKLLAQWRRWHEVEKWLTRIQSSDPVVHFLIEEITSFLRGSGMAFNRVEWQYVGGVKSLVDLAHMLYEACLQAKLTLAGNPRTAWGDGEPYVGLNTLGNQFWLHVLWNSPHLVRFQFNEAKEDTAKLNEYLNWIKGTNGRWETSLDLLREDVHFFSLTTQHQVDALANFLKEAHDVGTKCIGSVATLSQAP